MKEQNLEDTVREVIRKMAASATMNLDLAKHLMEAVEEQAKKVGVKAVIAVSDAAGRPIAVHCMDGAYIGSFDVALNKTYTAVAFQMPTAELARLAAPGGSLYGIQNTNEGKIVIFGGGEPLYVGETLVGAIGVSGGSAKQDTDLGIYGVERFRELVNKNGTITG